MAIDKSGKTAENAERGRPLDQKEPPRTSDKEQNFVKFLCESAPFVYYNIIFILYLILNTLFCLILFFICLIPFSVFFFPPYSVLFFYLSISFSVLFLFFSVCLSLAGFRLCLFPFSGLPACRVCFFGSPDLRSACRFPFSADAVSVQAFTWELWKNGIIMLNYI